MFGGQPAGGALVVQACDAWHREGRSEQRGVQRYKSTDGQLPSGGLQARMDPGRDVDGVEMPHKLGLHGTVLGLSLWSVDLHMASLREAEGEADGSTVVQSPLPSVH